MSSGFNKRKMADNYQPFFFYDTLFKAFALVAKSQFCIRIIGLVFKLIITIP